jgi:hypothetical protein
VLSCEGGQTASVEQHLLSIGTVAESQQIFEDDEQLATDLLVLWILLLCGLEFGLNQFRKIDEEVEHVHFFELSCLGPFSELTQSSVSLLVALQLVGSSVIAECYQD